MDKIGLKMGAAFLWVVIYLGVLLLYTLFDVGIWRKITPKYSQWLNILFITISVISFILLLCNRTGYKIRAFEQVSFLDILLALGCSVLFYLLLDQCLDPMIERLFPTSEKEYQDTIQSLVKSPVTSLLRVCIIAPVIEEILMRGFVLGGVKEYLWNCGSIVRIVSFVCNAAF